MILLDGGRRIIAWTGRISDRRKALALLLTAVVGGFAYSLFLLGPRPFHPGDLNWMKGDPVEHYLGWLFYRQTPGTSFPLTWTDHLGYPIGSYISLTDPAIPLFLGSVRHLLPAGWQYFGWLAAVNASLLFYWGYRLTAVFVAPGPALAGAALLLLSSKFAFSVQGNYCGQFLWLIVAALTCLTRPDSLARPLRFLAPLVGLTVLAGVVHPYVGAIVGLIGGMAVVRLLVRRRCAWWAGGLALAVFPMSLAAVWGATGILSVGAGAEASGYSDYSFNLLSLFDHQDYWTLLNWPVTVFPDQGEEGNAYLGAGALLLLLVGAAAGRRQARREVEGTPDVAIALAVLCVLCITIALSNRITFGTHIVYRYAIPPPLRFFTQAFRAPGRFFWPVHVLLLLAGVVAVARHCPAPWRAPILMIGVILQFIDLAGFRSHTRNIVTLPAAGLLRDHDWDGATPESGQNGAVWSHLGEHHAHLVVLPAWQCGSAASPGGMHGYVTFGRLAAEQGMTINSYRASRYAPDSLRYHCNQMPAEVLAHGLSSDTAYVMPGHLLFAILAGGGGGRHQCRRVADYFLCVAASSGQDWTTLLPALASGSSLSFNRDGPGRELVQVGWQAPETNWIWTAQPAADFLLKLAEPRGPVHLGFDLFPLLGPDRPDQRVRLRLSEHVVADWTLNESNWRQSWPAEIAADQIPADGVIRLTLVVEATTSPGKIGYDSADTRDLGIAVRRITRSP